MVELSELNELLRGATIEDIVFRGEGVIEIHLLDKRYLELRAVPAAHDNANLDIWVDGKPY